MTNQEVKRVETAEILWSDVVKTVPYCSNCSAATDHVHTASGQVVVTDKFCFFCKSPLIEKQQQEENVN